jgi:hypothetical protein
MTISCNAEEEKPGNEGDALAHISHGRGKRKEGWINFLAR